MKVIVTGGSGLIGQALKSVEPKWIYLSSKDCDLIDNKAFNELIINQKPDALIHLAADVGGLFKNEAQRLSMYERNLQINNNVLSICYKHEIKRVICCLSTCVFPDGLGRTMDETDLHKGEPHQSNFGYAYAKRMMEVHCRLINQTKCYNYQCIVPTNIYGPNDNFHLDNGHVIPSLIHKAYIHSQLKPNSTFMIKGDGTPIRQFIHSSDIAKIIVHLIKTNNTEPIVICSPNENDTISILDLSKMIGEHFGITDILPENKSTENGQQIKTVSNDLLINIMPELRLKSLKEGIYETSEWFIQNYKTARK
jgi:GDP-L-fucose synthase